MSLYTEFWQNLLRDFNSSLDPEKPFEKTYRESGIEKIGNRKSYSGYLEIFGCDVRNHTNSQVFRDLAELVKKNGHIKTKLTGLLKVKVDKYLLVTFSYEPFSWELMMNRYRDYQDNTQMEGELYKWELVQKFQHHWIRYERKEINFREFIKGLKWGNLTYRLFPKNFEKLALRKADKMEEALIDFFNEERPLQKRIDQFVKEVEQLHEQVKEKPNDQLFLAERELATLLTFRYPERYTFFMPKFYAPLAKALGRQTPKKWQQLVDYYQIVEEFRTGVLPKYEDAIAVKNRLTRSDQYYSDDEHLVLVQDIFYVTLTKGQIASSEETDDSEQTDSDYCRVVGLLQASDYNYFIELLREIVNRFGLVPNQANTAFTVRNEINRLAFIVNNRLCLAIQLKNGQTEFLAIDGVEYSSPSEPFTNAKKETEAYLNYELTRDQIKQHKEGILKYIKLELDRNHISPRYSNRNKEFMDDVFAGSQSRPISPVNKILYGPPGTGKTYRLKTDYFPKYIDRETSISAEQHFEEVAKDLSWWQVVALALLETGEAKVTQIKSNRWVAFKAEHSESKNVHATLWGTLQAHTVEESQTVSFKQRSQPLIFDKSSKSMWKIHRDLVEEQVPELFEIKDSVDNYRPNPDKVIKRYVFTTFHQSFAYEDFMEGIKPKLQGNDEGEVEYHIAEGVFKKLCSQASLDPDHRYAIFIDEINRGNIANIFGELITLIEKDKRKGCEYEISVELPYSKKQFSVPANVDIYGTMNTADRSVEALDTALRRRFFFEEMMPAPEIIKEELGDRNTWNGFQISEILNVINKRIEVLVDRDHLIGHAYFLSLAGAKDFEGELRSIFTDKVIPLLQEYFYNDYVKIGMVLGAGFVKVSRSENHKFAAIEESLETEYEDRKLYRIVPADELDLKDALSKLMNHPQDEQTEG